MLESFGVLVFDSVLVGFFLNVPAVRVFLMFNFFVWITLVLSRLKLSFQPLPLWRHNGGLTKVLTTFVSELRADFYEQHINLIL